MTGTTIAQAIPIAISPILTRLYTPEDFGVFALYTSVATFLSVMATARYEVAIMLPKEDNDAKNVLALSTIIAVLLSVIILCVIYFFNSQITFFLGNPEISNWLYLIPVSVFFTGMFQILNYWNNRRKNYRRLAGNKILQTGSAATLNLGMGFSSLGVSGLIIGNITGQIFSVINLGLKSFRKNEKIFQIVSKAKIIFLAKFYKKFPIFNLPNVIIDGLRISGIDIMITKFFSSAILGQYYLSFRMLQAPMSLVGYSISQVFLQKITTAPKGDLSLITRKFIIFALFISFPIFLFIFLFAEKIFVFVFGNEWLLAGQSASLLAPWIMLNFLTSPISNIFNVINRQEIMFIFSVFYMAIPLILIYFFKAEGFIFVLALISSSMSIMLILFILLALYFTKLKS